MIKKISLITRSRCRSDRPPFQKTKEETLPPSSYLHNLLATEK
jgi:hypothetical protein